ncbi:MAG: hypothetical protein GX638_04995, partial [Crenarchaeota archaeon]|nr:hypothetical protein [Thermoproteota archaeon]
GDVVCGGFAVPMRKGFADEVYVVTSGEIASLYAANNIAKAIKRYSNPCGKLGGIIGNGRETKNEREVISAFAQKIGTQLVAYIPRSELIAQAELQSEPIIQYAPNSEIASIYKQIADYIELNKPPVTPNPLSDEELESFFRNYCYNLNQKKHESCGKKTATKSSLELSEPKIVRSSGAASKLDNACKVVSSNKKPAHGCSLAGAISVIRQIKDTVSVVHSPSGCSYIHFWSHMIGDLQSRQHDLTLPNIICTNMQETDVIYGGSENLKETIINVHRKFPLNTIFLVTSCPSGIIGEDISSIVEQLTNKGIPLVAINSDGIISGDYIAGIYNTYCAIAEKYIEKNVSPVNNSINVIGEMTIAKLGEPDFNNITCVLKKLGINLNCRFIRNTTINEIKKFKQAKLNILFTDEPTLSEKLSNFFKLHYNIEFQKLPIPAGFNKTKEFFQILSLHFNKMNEFNKIVTLAETEYEKQLATLRKHFSEKKVLIFAYSQNIDWLISTLLDLGVKIPKICVSTTSSNGAILRSAFEGKIKIENNFPLELREHAISETNPDFILSTPVLSGVNYSVPCFAYPLRPNYGFNSGIEFMSSLHSKLLVPFTEGWRNDKSLF